MLRGDVEHIFLALARGIEVGKIKRLGVYFAVHGELAQLAEFRGVHVSQRQRCFVQVLPGALVVVMIGDDVRAGRRPWRPAAENGTQRTAGSQQNRYPNEPKR